MAYYPDNWTDKELEALEKRIAEVFKEAEKDLDKEVKEYFAKFKLRDKEMQALVDAGEMTKDQYQQWRLTQMGRGQRFEALRDKVAERYTKANEVANAYVNDMTPSIYSLNRNYEAYQIEKTVGSCDFTMWDESTVRRLLVEQPDLMPYYPPSRALNRGIDLAYGKDQITKHVTSGIIRGLAPGKIANELMGNLTEMNRTSAVRAARTGITTAQNAGRLDSYIAAEKMGIQIKRRWVCTKDSRTRLDHGLADGQIVVGTKQPFVVGGYKMMFPGDKSMNAPGFEIYNCRCTTRTVEKDGIEAEPRQMRVRNAEGEWELVNEMTYSEWKNWKLGLENSESDDTIVLGLSSTIAKSKRIPNIVEKIRVTNEAIVAKEPVYAEELRTAYKNVKPKEGCKDVCLHGAQFYTEYEHQYILSTETLAFIISSRGDCHGENIRLLSCSTGKKDKNGNCVAQELANRLGVDVYAPIDQLNIHPDGKLTVGKKKRLSEEDGFTWFYHKKGGVKK